MNLALKSPPASIVTATPAAATPSLAAVPAVAALELRHVHKGYGRGSARSEVLSDLNLRIEPGEFVAIVGFSGSGKTTLVSLLAGLIQADSGEVLKDGRPITAPGPDRGIVFQSYSLMPWLTVRENVALAVDRVFANESADARAERVMRYVGMVGLTPAADKLPAQLSGGMRQRVSVARALATDPDVLLLDEPLSALDALTRANLQDEIVRIWTDDRKTVLLITNDVDEALMMADRIIPLETGPRARLGPAFTVDIDRPRDRREMNHDPRFQALRAEITQHLLGLAHQRDADQGAQVIPLPALVPRAVTAKSRPTLASVMRLRHAALTERIETEATGTAGRRHRRAALRRRPFRGLLQGHQDLSRHRRQGPGDGGRWLRPEDAARRVHLHHRPLGLRQEHGAVDGGGADRHHRRRDCTRRPRGHRRRPRPRPGVPGPQPGALAQRL